MSGRFKRHLSKASTSTGEVVGSANTSGAMARKKRRLDNVSSDDEERSFWTPKHLGDLKAYNRSASEAPAELFRKDLISAMKLADNEPLTSDDFWGITDQWKQEWERGVQVPVNPDSLPKPFVRKTKDYPRSSGDFRLPRRFIRVTHNDFFNNEKHVLSNLPTKAEKMCRYDMDNLDEAWLKAYNGERARMGAEPVPYHIFELIIEHLEETCWENIHKLLKTEETLAIEFDEDVICDVCRSPDREEGNEMVFCDICNICVHQACYGIMAIPSGSWLCRTCKLGIKPNCDLCPNKGGAMKSTKSGHKWAHVACALWIPEVSIGSVERMEPITKITNIPQSRWALVCVLCRERRGACIQCSVKSCKTAYHVTCAFKHGLEMKPIEDEENADNVKLRSYCEKHSRTGKKDSDGDSDGGGPHPPKKKQDINNEQKNKAKAAKLRQIESEFFKHVDVLQTSTYLDIDYETTETIFYYWKLKRRAGFNKSLLTPRCQELDLLSQQQEQDIERMKMFVQLRQYLERVRNLCYMVSRREKLSRSFLKTREQTFHKQAALLGNDALNFAPKEAEAIAEANHGHCIYDRIYSHPRAPIHSMTQFESIMGLIANSCKDKAKAGAKAPQTKAKEQVSKKKGAPKDINGLLKSSKKPEPELFKNPYRKPYFNGAEERRSRSRSHSNCGSTETSSTEDSDSSLASTKWNPPDPGGHISVFTSSEDEKLFNKSPKFNNNNNIRSKTMIELPSSTKNKTFRDTTEEPSQKTIRGRGAGRRGRGRPPTIRGGLSRSTTALKKENALFSSEEDKSLSPAKDSKMFDALIRTSTRSLRRDSSSSPIKKEPKSLADTSDEEGDKKKQLNRVVRGKGVRKPVRQEALSSSEEELPTPLKAPAKRGKGRGRGRGTSSRKHSTTAAPASWPAFLPKFSDEEDNLGPATYKLTSEEDEKSDKSVVEKEVFPSRLDLFGASSDNRSDVSDNGSPVKKEVIKRISKGSDSEEEEEENNESEEENKESGEEESLSHLLQLKTKAAMKEFTPKIEAKVEKLNRRRGDRSTKALRGSSTTERIKAEPKPELNDVNCSKESTKLGENEPSHDLTLFVPQRAAAKKASELITSQNTGGTAVNQTSCHPPLSQEPTADKKQQLPKPCSDVIESESSLPLSDDPVKDKKSSSQRMRRGRSSKERQEELRTEVKTDAREEESSAASEPPKRNIFEPPEILPYVPIREAARKAAENMKGGSAKAGVGGAPLPPQGEDLETVVGPSTPTKQKKNQPKADTKTLLLRSSKSKSPRSSAKVLGTGSETEEELETAPSIKRTGKEPTGPNLRVDKNRSIFSESEDEVLATSKKEKMLPEKTPELGKELLSKQQLFRGDIFVRDHQSSSENDEEEKLKSSHGRESSVKVSKKEAHEPPPKEDRNKNHSFRSSRNLTRLFGSEGDLREEEEHEAENEEPPAETRRKAPDKKLKTSDGRPEHGFQPPVTPRDESRVPHDKPASKVSGPPSVPSEEGEQRVREGGAKCRPGAAPGDVAHKDIRSDTDAPLSIRKQRPSSEAVPDGGERELDGRGRRDGSEGHARGKENREKEPRNLQYQHQPSAGKVQLEEPPISQQQQQQKLCLSEPQHHQKPQHQSKPPKATPEKRFKSTFECISSSVEEEATLIKKEPEVGGGCNNKGNLNVFNFTEKDVEVERLEDIDESSDPEPEPKKVKITDIDEEAVSIAEGKVEQPKDSGYKSAIATPEPIDKAQPLCNDIESCQYNNAVINDQIPTDVSLGLKKTRLQQLNSPTQLKNNTTRYISPGRRKNLEDVIEERKKIAEQSEFEASLLLDKRIEGSKPLSPQLPDPDSDPMYSEAPSEGGRDGTRISQLPISGSTSTGSSVCSTSSAPSSFVEEWREQWEKSPTSQAVQMEHMEVPASYPPLGHPGLPLNDYPCPPYLDPTNPLSAANLMLLSRFNMINSPLNQNMMQIAMLRQLRKSHDSPLEDDSNLKVDITSRLPSRDDPRPFYGLGECDRSMRMGEHPPKVQIGHHNASKPSAIPSSESSERSSLENKGLPQIVPVSASQSTFIPSTSLEPLKLSYPVTSVASSQSRPFSQSSSLSEVRAEAPEPVSVGLDQSKPPMGETEPLKKLSSGSDSSKSIGDALEKAKAVPASESPKQVVAASETPKSIASVIELPSVSVGTALEPSKSDKVNLEPVKPTITKLEHVRSIVTRSESSESVVTRLEASKSIGTRLEQSKSAVAALDSTNTVEPSLEPSKNTSARLKSPKSIKPETEKPVVGHSTLKMSSANENNVSVSHVVSSSLSPTSTVTNSFSKLSSVPVVSSAATTTKKTTSVVSSNLTNSKSAVKKIQSPTSVVSTKVTTTSSVASIISSTHKTTTCDVSSLKVTSPIPSVLSPTSSTLSKGSSPNLVTVDTSVLHSPPTKRIPIYMQDPKVPKSLEKRSPRAPATSPRWSTNKDKKERNTRASRSVRGKGGRGRGSVKNKRKGGNLRYNSISVPKELVGTVYEFDDDFDDDGPANSALDDLRMLREKRQSVDTTPVLPPVSTPVSTPTSTPSSTPTSQSQTQKQKQTPNVTPVYINETKDQPPKKRVKEKRVKPAHKDRTSKREEEDEVAKILKDYRNQQNSTLKSVHEPSPPQAVSPQDSKKGSNNHHHHSAHPSPAAGTHHIPEEDPLSLSEYKQPFAKVSASSSSDDRKKQDGAKGATELLVLSSASYTATSVVSSLPEDRTNQLKLKIKGPYANSYLNNNLSNPPVEASVNPAPPSTTTTLRRMRKKELIMQYCSSVSSGSNTPPQQQRTGITFPKAVASMTSVPTKEDYKMYTQDGSTSRGGNSTRRRRQPRELNQLDWTLLDDSKIKRNSEVTPEGGRKRARAGKEIAKAATEETPGLHVTRTLRISLGKKGSSEVSEVTTVPPAESLKGKPPKKRHEDVFSQVKSDNLKFRKEIMANFDKRGSKTVAGEKKSRKRKFGFGDGSSGSSPLNSEIKEENSIGSSNDAQPKRIVLKISKTKSESPGGSETEERHGAAGGSHTNPNQPIPYPLKIRLNLANLSKNDSCGADVSVRKRDTESPRLSSGGDQILPLKIKLQRRPEGYVTSKSSSLDESCALDQGPGPPPEPPDPPLDPPPANPLRNDSPIEHKDREALPPAAPTTHSRISEDVIQRLEAQLAATDGPPSTPDPSSSPPPPPIPQSSFPPLQPLASLKDESGCR